METPPRGDLRCCFAEKQPTLLCFIYYFMRNRIPRVRIREFMRRVIKAIFGGRLAVRVACVYTISRWWYQQQQQQQWKAVVAAGSSSSSRPSGLLLGCTSAEQLPERFLKCGLTDKGRVGDAPTATASRVAHGTRMFSHNDSRSPALSPVPSYLVPLPFLPTTIPRSPGIYPHPNDQQ